MKRFLWLLLLVSHAVLAQGTLEVIALRHRTAEQVIPVLRPLLEPGGALSGQFNQLIVRTSPANLAQIRAVLETIDRPMRRLAISVRFDNSMRSARDGVATDARISNRGAAANVRIEEARSTQEEQVDQRMQVLEGGQAFISTGESRLFGEAATGFAVVPRLSGNNVFLDITTQRENFAPGGAGTVQSERAASTVGGRLGEWFELGGATSTSVRSGSGVLSARQGTAIGERRIWVKVEEVAN